MKKYSLILLTVCFYQLSFAQNNDVPFLTRSFANESIKNVEATTSGGNITVAAVSAGQAKIEVFVWSSNRKNSPLSKEQIQKRLDEDHDLTISTANGKLAAIAKSKRNISDWKNALSISFKIYVPGNVSTELTTSGGNIHLTDLSGTQDFTTSGGNLHAEKLKGKIKGRTSGGNIHVKEWRGSKIKTSNFTNFSGSIEDDEIDGKINGGGIPVTIRASSSRVNLVIK